MSRPTVGTSRPCPHSREIWYLSLRAETKKARASKYTTLGVKDSFKVFFRKPYVIFMEFKNEPHTRHSGLFWPLTWNCIYLHIRRKNSGKGSTCGRFLQRSSSTSLSAKSGKQSEAWVKGLRGDESPEQCAAARLIKLAEEADSH